MTDTGPYRLRAMSRSEVDIAVRWAEAEGWNPGRVDADIFFATDPCGFLAGVLGPAPIATISAVNYGGTFGFIGFYIVDKRRRGQGYGMTLWRGAMARLGGVACVGLDGVLEEEASYRRSGFVTAYRNRRYGGAPPRAGAAQPTVDARAVPFRLIADLDRRMFPAPREGFLAQWITAPGHRARAVVTGEGLAGLGVARPCAQGFKIGPLYAADRGTAERLIVALCDGMGGGPVFLDVPEVNAAAVALAESFGWTAAFETVRMYRGAAPVLDLPRLYGVTTFELG